MGSTQCYRRKCETQQKPDPRATCWRRNSNKSFNAVVFTTVPKAISGGKNIVDVAVYIVVGIYNDGLSSIMRLMRNLDMQVGWKCICMEVDERRIKYPGIKYRFDYL